MTKPIFDKPNKVLIYLHAIGNIALSILFIAQLEAMNGESPFTTSLLPVQVLMLVIFSFYVANFSILLSCSPEATAPSKVFIILVNIEALLLVATFVMILLTTDPKFKIFCLQYGFLFVLNLSIHLIIRIRIHYLSITPTQKQIKKLMGHVLTKREAKNIQHIQTCSICLGDLRSQKIIGLPCNPLMKHYFHRDCFVKWFSRSRECPVCRQDASVIMKNSVPTQNSLRLESSLSNWRETVQ